MALPSKQEFDALLISLNNVAKDYDDSNDLESRLRRMAISAQAKKLVRALTTPEQMPIQHGINMAEIIAIHTLMKLKILEAIPQTGSISLEDLSKATGAQDSLLATGFLDQVEVQPSHPNTDGSELEYKHTKFSLAYTIPSSQGQQQQETKPGHLFTVLYNQYLKLMLNFADSYLPFVAALARSQNQSQNQPSSSHTSSHASSHSFSHTFSQSFSHASSSSANPSSLDPTSTVSFSFSSSFFPPSSSTSLSHGAREPQDPLHNPFTFSYGQYGRATAWEIMGQDPERLETFQRGIMAGGAKAYFMRMILHDHCDEMATQILTRLAEAMSHDSRVLVCELVLPQRVGEADLGAAVLDQCVMSIGGKERTEEGFRNIFEAAGLELVKVWRVPGVTGACVEGRLKGGHSTCPEGTLSR
ncbi:hypothetical protein QBC45DRAFT_431795 [Copromyces sp. CBS 386.78]|nr:hypothetical protein QBC45DRAFT_431795 [Copromyces sp. CBS 386.78]